LKDANARRANFCDCDLNGARITFREKTVVVKFINEEEVE
jgi:uncharacterized protein YjbI with pentapeptide repeats